MTIFTIAHRLATIIDYDKVLVLNAGEIIEYKHPYLLLVKDPNDNGISNEDGEFASMILETGEESSRALFTKAKSAYQDYLKRQE